VAYSLGTRVDYAMMIKVYAKNREGEQKYSPPEVVETRRKIQIGNLSRIASAQALSNETTSVSVPLCAV
jgi:hypothetical protein